MQEDKLFQIGDVAKLFHISVSSLRHYEALGLLVPQLIDKDTGYRYYSVRQFEVLNTIRYLRALDMPLSEIAEFVQNRDIAVIEKKLFQQKQIVAAKIQQLQRIQRKIDNRLQQLEDAQHSQFDTVIRGTLKSCRIVLMSTSLTIRNFWDMEGPIRQLERSKGEGVIFLGKVGVGISQENLCARRLEQYDCIFLILDDEDWFEGDTITLPQTSCVSIRFQGSHTQAQQPYLRLLSYIREHRLTISGFSREITMIDYGVTEDTEKFVTEISIPISEKEGCGMA